MDSSLLHSRSLLVRMLQEPGGMSIFPSSLFWQKDISQDALKGILTDFFSGPYNDITNPTNKTNLYIHIPFCKRICSYCNCFKTLLQDESKIETYLDYLSREAEYLFVLNNRKKIPINTIFIGGWTPNILSISQFESLFSMIHRYFDLSLLEQCSVDCHPNLLNEAIIDMFHRNGVNRVTVAIQTLDDSVLQKNNRDTYHIQSIIDIIHMLQIRNMRVNIDLLIWLNGQTFESIKHDIDFFTNMGVDTISDHYMTMSRNVRYTFDKWYMQLCWDVKSYLQDIKRKNTSENLQESYFASKRSSMISLGAEWVTNIFAGIIYQKPPLDTYYRQVQEGDMPFGKGYILDIRQEQIKYLYLNIFQWIRTEEFISLFGVDIFHVFWKEIEFLLKNKIIRKDEKMLYKNCNDLHMYLALNTLFLKSWYSMEEGDMASRVEELPFYFYPDGSRIDD